MRRVWEIRGGEPADAEILSRALDIPLLLAGLLLARGVTNPEEGRRFLTPSLGDLEDPRSMLGMQKAVQRLMEALRAGDSVCIYGDYDVDGVTSVSLLLLFLRSMGLQAEYYIPSRMTEGYGLNEKAVEDIAARGTKLLITVDCGISDISPVKQASEAGMDVIIIDHHQVPLEVPVAVAVLDPHQPGCDYPTKDLAAVGVAFSLVMALRVELRERGYFKDVEEPNLREYLDLVSLGTVADIVPLLGDNRVITHFGLTELTAGRRPGVAALKEVSGIMNSNVSVGHVAFRLAPRINAVGRLGKAASAVELLTTNSYMRALELARELDQTNSERQSVEHDIFKDAFAKAEEVWNKGSRNSLVLASSEWHVGVVGIVASRLVDRFGCPVVLIALDGETGRGSARGTEQTHLYQAFDACSDFMEGFGGHKAAAGLSIRADQVDGLREAFDKVITKQLAGAQAKKTIFVDAEVHPSVWTNELVEQLQILAPHGLGNPEPVFMARGLQVRSSRMVGRESPYHLKLALTDGDRTWDAIGFGMGDRMNTLGEQVDLVYNVEFNTWDGQTSIQLKLKDIR